ncbi:hypothetical protein KP509_31G047700 [Ceratopteris richardii]|nr:hypothetical protein KP509_31G047700 [Ceratopteris richardii]
MQPELFFKMSHEVYNFGEGLIGKVAADNSHKWVYKEPLEGDVHEYPSSWAQGALDPYPRTWEAQFKSGIETIAIVAVKEGVIQLGSLKKTYEDLNFVLFLQRKFNYLQSVPGVFTVHPAVMHHAAISKKTSSIAASNWCPSENVDLVEDQRKTRHRRSAAAIGLSATSGDAADVEYYENLPNNRLPSAQEDSNGDHIFLSSAHHHQQISCQLDGSPSSPALHTSLHTLLSRLPSVSCRRS